MPFTRRDFLKRGTLFVAMGVTAPTFLTRTASVLAEQADACMTGPHQRRVLVVVQLGGGNDSLNAVVPYGDPLYYQARPTLAIPQSAVLPLSDRVGLNPALGAFKALADRGALAIVQGVGYPNPNRSHFRSTDIWTSGRPDVVEPTGWLGRYLDNTCTGEDRPLHGVDIGDTASRLFWTGQSVVPALTSVEGFDFLTDARFPDDRSNHVDVFRQLNADQTGAPYRDAVARASIDALTTAAELKRIAGTYRSTVVYPDSGFAKSLQTVAQLLSADLGTRIVHLTLGGFDTHAGQAKTHDRLLQTVGEGIAAFLADIAGLGLADDVALMTFSEFGRRVHENGSAGTDHGAAASLYVAGAGIRGGLFGQQPSLAAADLDNGDLRFNVDFRAVYATLLHDWLGTDPTGIIGAGAFSGLGFIRDVAPSLVATVPAPPPTFGRGRVLGALAGAALAVAR